MSTGNIESWTGAISQIGPIYPFVGWETFFFIVGTVCWIGWHIWQVRFENRTYREDLEHLIKKKP